MVYDRLIKTFYTAGPKERKQHFSGPGQRFQTGGHMQRIAKFEKISFGQFKTDWIDTFPGTSQEAVTQIYEGIQMPSYICPGGPPQARPVMIFLLRWR